MSNSFVTPQTVACQAPLSMGFPSQEYWSGLPFSSSRSSWPGDRTSISHISCSGRQILYHWATREAHCISWIWAVELPRRVNSNMGLSASGGPHRPSPTCPLLLFAWALTEQINLGLKEGLCVQVYRSAWHVSSPYSQKIETKALLRNSFFSRAFWEKKWDHLIPLLGGTISTYKNPCLPVLKEGSFIVRDILDVFLSKFHLKIILLHL